MKRIRVVTGLLLLCVGVAARVPFAGAAASDMPFAGIHTIRAGDDLMQLAARNAHMIDATGTMRLRIIKRMPCCLNPLAAS